MTKYEIIITPGANEDLLDIRNYIAEVLMSPDTALSYIQAIRKEIGKLEKAAKMTSPVEEEPWHSRGVRRITAKNFYIYYRIDEDSDTVYVLNVIYNKRDQFKALAEAEN